MYTHTRIYYIPVPKGSPTKAATKMVTASFQMEYKPVECWELITSREIYSFGALKTIIICILLIGV